MKTNQRKLTLSAMLIAITVIFSTTFYIPVGAAKCFPVQHLINVIAAVFLGPVYGVLMAFVSSLIRNILGTGSLLAFPGSMIGALLSGILYAKFSKLSFAYLGEVIGTGIIGALCSYPVAVIFLGAKVALFGFVIPFSVSSIGGTLLAVIIISSLYRTKVFNVLKDILKGAV